MKTVDSLKDRKSAKMLVDITFCIVVFCMFAFWLFEEAHGQDNLPKEYQEVFSTPFDKVSVSDYWNSSVGHGTKFSFLVDSTVPIEIKNESQYEKREVQEKNRYPWATSALYLEKQSGDITILLDQSRRLGHVRMQTPNVWAMTSDCKRLHKFANFPWPNELFETDKALNQGWAKGEEAKGFQFCNMGANSAISVLHIMDPRHFAPEEFDRQIRKYLSDLERYNPQNMPEKVAEKILEVYVPDFSLSKDEVTVLSKIAAELSANYAEPSDGKTWQMKSRNGQIPIRLKVFVECDLWL